MSERPPFTLPREKLRHSPGEIVVGLTSSPRGKDCIGMNFDEQEWLLLTTKRGQRVDLICTQLEEAFNIKTVTGMAFDWRESLSNKRLILDDRKDVIGIYVPAEKFDELIARMTGL